MAFQAAQLDTKTMAAGTWQTRRWRGPASAGRLDPWVPPIHIDAAAVAKGVRIRSRTDGAAMRSRELDLRRYDTDKIESSYLDIYDPIPADPLSEAQKKAVEKLVAARGTDVTTIFQVLL